MRALAASLLLAAIAAGSAAACPEPTGAEIYPTAEVLPANLLRAYVYLPRPMGRGDALDHVDLLDAAGRAVPGVFLSNRYELWSPDRRRLTLLLDPGRVKTGLAAHAALGRALEEGARYRLTVRGTAEDAQGCVLGAATVHSFTVGPPDLDPPRPEGWTLSRPRAGTVEPLSVALGSPHDHLSPAYRLRVRDAAGVEVPGRIALGPGERDWRFTPARPWPSGAHVLAVDRRLEDLAGNRPGALFDGPVGSSEANGGVTPHWAPEAAID